MSRFTVRVELHRADDDDDYELLHAEMEKRGFARTIRGSDGLTYQLPPAEYDFHGSVSTDAVLDVAQHAANATGRRSSILVTEAISRRWRGLPRI